MKRLISMKVLPWNGFNFFILQTYTILLEHCAWGSQLLAPRSNNF